MIAPLPIAPATTANLATDVRQSLIARQHTVLGVCEGIGEDLGFNPLYLRLAFASGIFFAPMLVVGIYLALGVVVAASRLAFPVTQAAPAREIVAEVEAEQDYRIAA